MVLRLRDLKSMQNRLVPSFLFVSRILPLYGDDDSLHIPFSIICLIWSSTSFFHLAGVRLTLSLWGSSVFVFMMWQPVFAYRGAFGLWVKRLGWASTN